MPLEIDEWDANDGDDVDYDATKKLQLVGFCLARLKLGLLRL